MLQSRQKGNWIHLKLQYSVPVIPVRWRSCCPVISSVALTVSSMPIVHGFIFPLFGCYCLYWDLIDSGLIKVFAAFCSFIMKQNSNNNSLHNICFQINSRGPNHPSGEKIKIDYRILFLFVFGAGMVVGLSRRPFSCCFISFLAVCEGACRS